jgi:hypothetical protein
MLNNIINILKAKLQLGRLGKIVREPLVSFKHQAAKPDQEQLHSIIVHRLWVQTEHKVIKESTTMTLTQKTKNQAILPTKTIYTKNHLI